MPSRGETGRRRSVPTTATAAGEHARGGRWFLLVAGPDGLRVQPLPEAGEVVLGRHHACDVVLDAPAVSRRHARLRVGARCTVADLGSRHGTLLRGERLAAERDHGLDVGDSLSLGPFAVSLLTSAAPLPISAAGGARLSIDDPTAATTSAMLVAVARAPVSLILYGETGVGKELLAGSLHRLSGRNGPLVGINCAALSEPLLESELFGHERGAFTGAVQAKEGLLRAATGGTVLLDEIGDMPPSLQVKLLRAIESREVLPVGGVRPVPVDVRFIAATHRDLFAMAQSGEFRRDLYYRLAGFALEIPPLRQRRDRITTLAAELLAEAAARAGAAPPAITPPAAALLAGHAWPGNVRELRNVIERALVLARGGAIRPEHILLDAPAAPAPAPAQAGDDERARILAALEACAGNQTRAARMLGMARTTLVQRILVHRLRRPRKAT